MKIFEKFKWTDKPELKREHALIASIAGVMILGYFKLRPYFDENVTVVAQSEHSEHAKAPKGLLEKFGIFGASQQSKQSRESGGGRLSSGPGASGKSRKTVIERPLFDGLEVTLRGTLLNSISSLAPENPAELIVTGMVPTEITQGMDDSEVRGAQLNGVVSPNTNKKRLNITFSQITTKEGRNFQVTGYAVDLINKTLGIAADYSSGIGSRLLGAVFDQAIVVGDQIGMAKIVNSNSGNPTTAGLQVASIETNQQATNEISQEATKSLRETPSELSVPAGTTITFKIRVQGGSQ